MKTKKTPERQCISCRNMFPKKDLIRVVKQADGTYFIDETNKSNGRGAYICNKEECINKCIKSKLLNTEDGTVKHDTLKLSSIIFSYLFR